MTIPLRILVVMGCVLLGFVFIPMFFVAAVIAWSVFSDVLAPQDTTPRDPSWEAGPTSIMDVRNRCESPAETAFLDEMLSAFGLEPAQHGLERNGLRLRNQVQIAGYRVDFLVDERLVIEIDGAEWHSSPEAMARDRVRDTNLKDLGYTILRIPAKMTLYEPMAAIAKVEAARADMRQIGSRGISNCDQAVASKGEPIGMRTALGAVSDAIGGLNAKTLEFYDRIQIDTALAIPLVRVEVIVASASELAAIRVKSDKLSGNEPDQTKTIKYFDEAIRKIWDSAGEEISAGAELSEKLPKLVEAVSRKNGLEYCAARIEAVVDDHLDKLSKAHAAIFPDRPAFRTGLDRALDPRKDLIGQLRAICFDGVDPTQFAHPYRPPSYNLIFLDWWVKNIAGVKPIFRSTSGNLTENHLNETARSRDGSKLI